MAPSKKRYLRAQAGFWTAIIAVGLTFVSYRFIVHADDSPNRAPVLTRAQFDAQRAEEEAKKRLPPVVAPAQQGDTQPSSPSDTQPAVRPVVGPATNTQTTNPPSAPSARPNTPKTVPPGHGALRNPQGGASPHGSFHGGNPAENFHGNPHDGVRTASLTARLQEGEEDLRPSLMDQTDEDAMAKSWGCLQCHQGVEKMHRSEKVRLGCCDCHGGDPTATTKECAHALPRFPQLWPKAGGTPQATYALLNLESPEFVRFINPGDWRAVNKTCGTARCHEEISAVNVKSMMGHTAMVPQSALYNNGSVPNKIARFGESYGYGGVPQRLFSTPRPTLEDVHVRGVLPWIDPLPHFEITQPGNIFRVLEINNNATSLRGPGTDARTDAVFLNLVKTKLNDPTMVFLGQSDNPGDYRTSGCTSCHVVYANDRDPAHSAWAAVYGNHGYSATADPTIPRGESGHPIKHQMTRAIPSSQCLTCHFHQGSGASGSYYGYMWWDYESDAESVYSRYGLPKPSGYIGVKGNEPMHELAPEVNPEIVGSRFADYHNAGWLMSAVYLRNKKGWLLDREGEVIEPNDPDWHGKAVHLADIHMTKGLHCIDCHFKQDNHGDGRLYGEMINPIEINCQDCHGTVSDYANLITSNHPGGTNLLEFEVPYVDPKTGVPPRRFEWKDDGTLVQRSMVTPGLEWEVTQVKDVITPGSDDYNRQAHYAKTIQRDGVTWGVVESDPSECKRAHTTESMTCYTCHSSWNTTCAGCHLDATTNTYSESLHYEGGFSKNYAAYNPQVMRHDGFLLGINGSVKGNRVSPVRGASGVIVSAAAGNRQMVLHQQPTISAEGHAGHAFTTNPPHTVGPGIATQKCSRCHVSDKNDNNATVGGVMGLGANGTTFMGRYLYVGESTGGFEAVRVTSAESWPQPVIGSNMQRIIDPTGFRAHYNNGGYLREAHHHKAKNCRSVWHMGEWVLSADGPGGFVAYDIANVHNKDEAQKITTSLISPLGQRQYVPTRNATSVCAASVFPTDPDRSHRPENQEQPLHPLFRYAYITDYVEGLILVDISTLFDGNPSNNFFERTVTYNPNGILSGAMNVKIWGEFAYVLTCNNGLVVVDISDPCNPSIAAQLGDGSICKPKSIAFQFRYAFITDCEGLKIVDITSPFAPTLAATVPLDDARDVFLMRTYAYIAAGKDGLAVLDVENPERPGEMRFFTGQGCINDATSVVCGMTYASMFCYVADGRNGVRVIQLLSPADGHHIKGASPEPNPRLIATYRTKGPAVSIAPGMPRDRYVDIDGNQVSVFGRLGSRPFNRKEMRRLYLRNGQLYTVSDTPIEDGYVGPKPDDAEEVPTPEPEAPADPAPLPPVRPDNEARLKPPIQGPLAPPKRR